MLEIFFVAIFPKRDMNFCSLCQGASKEIALHLLEACNGDLQMAVGMHMDGTGNGETASGQVGQDQLLTDISAAEW